MADVLTSFGNAIRAAQLVLEGDPVMDGTRQRIPADGGKKGNLAGSYIGWQNGARPAGSIENFLAGTKDNWKYQGEEKMAPLSSEQIAGMAAERERRAKELDAQYEGRALAAARRWGRAHDMAPGETTPYLARKQVVAVGLRRDGDNLLVPLRDVDGNLWSIQTIFPEKRALTQDAAPIDKVMSKGAKKAGNFHLLGEVRPCAPVLVAEGYATSATGHIATNYATVVAIDSGNLDAVVGAIKGRYPDSPILILGDDDRHSKRNVGREKAEAAAEKYHVGVVFPQFATEGQLTDFNDLHVSEGLGAVKLQIEQSLSIYLTRSETMSKQNESDRSAAAADAAIGPPHQLDVPLLNSKQDALTATNQAAQVAAGQLAPAQRRMSDAGRVVASDPSLPQNVSWIDAARRDYPEASPVELANNLIGSYRSAQYKSEYSYSDTVNPDGISSEVLSNIEDIERNKMMAALSVIKPDELDDVLKANLDSDFDGSSFAVTDAAGVRQWMAKQIINGNVVSPLENSTNVLMPGHEVQANNPYQAGRVDNAPALKVANWYEEKLQKARRVSDVDRVVASVPSLQGARNADQTPKESAVENAIEMVRVRVRGRENNAERFSIEARLLDEIKENSDMMLSAPNGAITSHEAITLVADDLQLLDGIHPLEQRERALLLMHESCHAQEEYAAQFVDVAGPELQAEMAAALQARKAELAAEDGHNRQLQAGMQAEAEPAKTAGNTIEMVAVRELDAEQAPLDVQRMVEISANANAMTIAPEGAITHEEATILASHDLKLLGEMTTPHLRERALWVMAESRKAQPAYKTQFTRLAPPELHQLMAAAVTARTDEFRKWDMVDRALKEGTQTNGGAARTPIAVLDALDAQTRKQLEEARERDRKAVEHSIIEARQEVGKWTGANTIERVDAPQRKPVAPAHVNLDKQAPELPAGIPAPLASDFNLTMIPPEVERVYLRDGHKFYHPKNQKLVAFEDHGKQLKTTQSSGPVAMAMVQIAEARGWKEIKVSGTEEFRKEAWREAAMRGIGVQGYKPTSLDLAELARRTPKKDAENNVAPTPQATQHGAYINADDAALMAAVKAARWGTARAPEAAPVAPTATPARTAAPVQHAAPVMPTTSAVQGDVLVAHGAARYEHDKDNPMSYFVTVANDQGKERTIWGVKLGEAIEKSGVETGDRISLIKNGETQVEVAANVKNDQGVVIAKEKIGAKRNEWAVKAHAFATRPAEQVVQAHQDLAGVVAIAAAIDQRAQADGYKPNERAYIEQRVREIATRSIASGNAPTLLYREACQATNHPQQERMQ